MMIMIENHDDAVEILDLPIVNNTNEASILAHEIKVWFTVGSVYIRKGEEIYGFENLGSCTMYSEAMNIRRALTSQERHYLKDLIKSEKKKEKGS